MQGESRVVVFEDDAFVVALGPWSEFEKEWAELFALRHAAFGAVGVLPEELIDKYDPHWQHLVSFEKTSRRIVGSYRLRFPQKPTLDTTYSVAGHLFDFSGAAQALLENGIELGRAALAIGQQRSFRGLLTLWRALIRIVDSAPAIQSLYGPITVDRRTPLAAITRLEDFLLSEHSAQWTEAVTPVHKRCTEGGSALQRFDADVSFRGLEHALCASGVDWRVPVLIRQYAGFGARFSRFGHWPTFGNAYVCFAAVDIVVAQRAILRERERERWRPSTHAPAVMD